MSKKMIKRSLALGALMAFVITGSAMATEVKLGTDEYPVDTNGVHTLNGYVYHDSNESDDDNFNNHVNKDYLNANLNGNTLFINANAKYAVNGRVNIQDTTGNLKIKNINTTADQGYGIALWDGSILNVNELEVITAARNAIYRPENGEGSSNIYANKIIIDSGNHAFQIHNDLFVGSSEKPVGEIEITADKKAFNVASNTAKKGATLEIHTKKLNVIKTGKESEAYPNAKLIVEAEEGKVATNFKAQNTGTVDLKFGSGIEWTGKFIAENNATKAALDLSGTWNLSESSTLTNATFNAGSTLVIDGDTFKAKDTDNVYAINGVGDSSKLVVANGAKLKINGMDEITYNLAADFKNYDINGWNVIADNALMNVTFNNYAEDGYLQATLSTSADAMENSGAAPVGSGDMLQDLIKNGSDNEDSKAAYEFIKEVTSNGGDLGASNNALSNALQMAEAGGNSGTAVTVANNVSSVTTGRMGFSGGEKGGHGVGLLAEDSGAAIWAQYVHGKDRVEDMPMSGGATSYEGQFNGVVMGVDFKKVGKFQSGVAFNYGEGDTNSFGNAISTRSDYDFWGVGYYGNIRNEDTNFIFDVNYAKSDSDVEQVNGGTTLEASPETTTWSAGVKVEKLYQNNNVQIVPYTGLRYMSVDTDSYKATNGTDTLFNYAPERQDIWLLPLGVSIKQEVTNANGWTVTPKVDLSYIWAFGDTDSEMTVAIPGVSSTSRLGYTVMDDESWLGVVGLEAAKGDWTFGVSYSYQKGDHSENEKWYVDAKYSF